MLADFFSFSGRLGRLAFFLRSLALFVAEIVVLAVGVAVFLAARGSPGVLVVALIGALAALVFLLAVIWSSFALQARRIRDIGWEPLYVIPGWIAVMVVVEILTGGAPGSAGWNAAASHSPITGLINLAMTAVLLFWPGKPSDLDVDVFGPSGAAPKTYAPWTPAAAPSPVPTRRVSSGPVGFGRRGS